MRNSLYRSTAIDLLKEYDMTRENLTEATAKAVAETKGREKTALHDDGAKRAVAALIAGRVIIQQLQILTLTENWDVLIGEQKKERPKKVKEPIVKGTCTFEGCDEVENARGLCRLHYMREFRARQRAGKTESHLGRKRSQSLLCTEEGCDTISYSKSLCRHHYEVDLAQARGTCEVTGCENPANATRARCYKHYQSERRSATSKVLERD